MYLGDMLQFASYDAGWDIEKYYDAFISTGVSDEMYRGRSRLVAGKSGVEIFYEVFFRLTGSECEIKPTLRVEKTPEYFAGWSLAFYSWYRNRSYASIQCAFPIHNVVN